MNIIIFTIIMIMMMTEMENVMSTASNARVKNFMAGACEFVFDNLCTFREILGLKNFACVKNGHFPCLDHDYHYLFYFSFIQPNIIGTTYHPHMNLIHSNDCSLLGLS